jgi:DNA-binding NtrC family response regulator
LVLLDLSLPDMHGLEVLNRLKGIDMRAVVIIITAYGDIATAVEAMRSGAYDFLTKPFDFEDIKMVINKALKIIGLKERINVLERQVDQLQVGEIITRSRKMNQLLDFVRQIAKTSTTVMIYGETGTGKELIANLIHKEGRGKKTPFITIDCTSLSEALLTSELFGHEKGAFTGATEQKRGLFEVADGGTVFLDEIGELPQNLQAKLLKVVETGQFRRVGGTASRETNVHLIGATNRDLKQLMREGRFRKDLYYRLNVVPIHVPPLRERKEDIYPLAEHFIRSLNRRIGRDISGISDGAVKKLLEYDWPGNVRELRNMIEHMIILTKGNAIEYESLPPYIRGLNGPRQVLPVSIQDCEALPEFKEAKKELLANFEKRYLQKILQKNHGNISKSAKEMKMHRSSFQRLLRKYGSLPSDT